MNNEPVDGRDLPAAEPDEPDAGTPTHVNAMNDATTTGPVVQAAIIYGGVHIRSQREPAGPRLLVPPPSATTMPPSTPALSGGTEAHVGDRTYLIHSDFLDEQRSVDGAVVRRQARGVQVDPPTRDTDRYVWLRQLQIHQDTPLAQAASRALRRERDLLASQANRRHDGFPRWRDFSSHGSVATLVLSWPAARSTKGPCESLESLAAPLGGPADPWRRYRLLAGLAGLCDALAVLHRQGTAHRQLAPTGILVLDNGRLVLRDLGLACCDFQPGEGPADGCRAPEQRRRSGAIAGPHTDVYQLAAVAYHLIAGQLPHPDMPLPVRAHAPDLPTQVADAIDAALSAIPTDRPTLAALRTALRTGSDALPEEPR